MNVKSNIIKIHNAFQNIFARISFTVSKHLFGTLHVSHYSFKKLCKKLQGKCQM